MTNFVLYAWPMGIGFYLCVVLLVIVDLIHGSMIRDLRDELYRRDAHIHDLLRISSNHISELQRKNDPVAMERWNTWKGRKMGELGEKP